MTPIEMVRTVYESTNLGTVAPLVHPDVRISQTPLLPWGGEYHGLMGVMEFYGKLTQAIESRVEVEHIFEAGDRVAVSGRTRGTVRATGSPFDVRVCHIWTLRDGKLAAFEPYIDTPEMLRALQST